MKCVLHLLATESRHAAATVLMGLALCAHCTRRSAQNLVDGETTPKRLVRDALEGYVP